MLLAEYAVRRPAVYLMSMPVQMADIGTVDDISVAVFRTWMFGFTNSLPSVLQGWVQSCCHHGVSELVGKCLDRDHWVHRPDDAIALALTSNFVALTLVRHAELFASMQVP